jgi:hypothetical protein
MDAYVNFISTLLLNFLDVLALDLCLVTLSTLNMG